jgi:hypothetical protein
MPFSQFGVLSFGDFLTMPIPHLGAIRPDYSRAIVSMSLVMLIPDLCAIHPDYGRAAIPMLLTMLIPKLRTITPNLGWSIVTMIIAVLISPVYVVLQAASRCLPVAPAQRLVGCAIMNQTINVIWLSGPDMQFAAFPIYSWVRSKLFCGYLASMPPAVWFTIRY